MHMHSPSISTVCWIQSNPYTLQVTVVSIKHCIDRPRADIREQRTHHNFIWSEPEVGIILMPRFLHTSCMNGSQNNRIIIIILSHMHTEWGVVGGAGSCCCSPGGFSKHIDCSSLISGLSKKRDTIGTICVSITKN